ncbi:MAG TPA: sensor domain-containing diguanylate cyclase [Acetivibrio sp.]|nr:sensor domain-containing diguanylate cyclase [Acetivibrio sp.]
MNRIGKYELMLLGITWLIIGTIAAHVITVDAGTLANWNICPGVVKVCFLLGMIIFSLIKAVFAWKDFFGSNKFYMPIKLLEVLFIHIAMVFIGAGEWANYILLFLVMVTALCVGRKFSFILVGYSLLLNIVMRIVNNLYFLEDGFAVTDEIVKEFPYIISVHLVMFLLAVLCSWFYSDNNKNEQQNRKLFMELANRYDQVAAAQEEIKVQNGKLKDANCKLEETNKKLMTSLAELFTLQQITQAISSILDIDDLLKDVNDIIIGVMGVSSSTIIRYDDKKCRLKVHTTNVSKRNGLITLNDNINCDKLMDVLETGDPVIENCVNANDFPFTEGRGIKSLICVPLVTKSRKFGLVLVEHMYSNAFDENNLRLLNIIGQQVGIAMENVELYQRMHELATVDGLTGVYNRLYFQERLKEEFESAKKEKYDLSLALLDIDHFKKFNDTFGHLFGDKVLSRIATLIKNSLRSDDIIARYGGEEFVILLPRTGINEAYYKVERLRDLISKTSITDGKATASVTVSFGVSSYPEFSSSEAELLKMADDALYDAKESGRNCVKITGGN